MAALRPSAFLIHAVRQSIHIDHFLPDLLIRCSSCVFIDPGQAGLWRCRRDQRIEFLENFGDGCWRQRANETCVARPPIQTSDLVRQNGACNRHARRDHDFERVAFDLVGDRTEDCQTDPAIVGDRRQNNRRSSSCLFVARLRSETDSHRLLVFDHQQIRAYPLLPRSSVSASYQIVLAHPPLFWHPTTTVL